MNLYLIDQDEVSGYDTYDSAIVAAESEEEARNIHPGGNWNSHNWCSYPSDVNVKHIGTAAAHIKRGIIITSYHAG